jgi:hypothetical protein
MVVEDGGTITLVGCRAHLLGKNNFDFLGCHE